VVYGNACGSAIDIASHDNLYRLHRNIRYGTNGILLYVHGNIGDRTMRSLIVLISMLVSSAVAAQVGTPADPGMPKFSTKSTWEVPNLDERYDASTELGKAMNICAEHRHRATLHGVNNRIDYDDGWEACNAVHSRWEKTEEAKRKEPQEKEFIQRVGKQQ
jgi:hypothetical protein